jgi:CheY-like chemotaxis protein
VRTPILALTANASLDDRHACLEAGFDVYLTKPVTPQALRDTVSQYAEQGRVAAQPKAA